MPLKWKDNSATSAVSGPKAKWSKSTPTFQTPTAAGIEATSTPASELISTKNQVVTLWAIASGCHDYHTQDLASSSNSSSASPAAELSQLPSHIPDECDPISHPTEESNIHPQAESDTSKSRLKPKQKNTTTVRQNLIIAGIPMTSDIDKTYRMAGLPTNLLGWANSAWWSG